MDPEPKRPAWDEADDEESGTEEQLTDDAIRRRLVRDLRLKGGKVPSWLWQTLDEESYLGDARGGPSGYQLLLERARFLLYDRRVKRAGRAKKMSPQQAQMSPILEPEEARRSEVLSRELARLALRFGGHWDAEGNRIIAPSILHYREAYLGGGPITEDQAGEFIDSPAVQYLSLSQFRKEEIPLVGHTARITSQQETVEGKRVRREYHFAIEWRGGSANTWVRHDLGPAFVNVRVPLHLWRFPEKRALWSSALADLQKVGSTLAKHYLWDEGEANWFVLTGVPPSTPCFRIDQQGGLRNDHVQHRLVLSIQPWVSAKTVMRAYRKLQKDILRRENRQPRLDRLELMEFTAERRQAGMPWRDVMIEWNRTHRRWSYGKDGVRNFQRDFEEIYHLVVAGRGKPRKAKAKKA